MYKTVLIVVRANQEILLKQSMFSLAEILNLSDDHNTVLQKKKEQSADPVGSTLNSILFVTNLLHKLLPLFMP